MTAFRRLAGDCKEPWILFGVTSIILVLLAHYLFQGWLYMLPCEQCVYIRYGNIVMAIGAFLIYDQSEAGSAEDRRHRRLPLRPHLHDDLLLEAHGHP